jgi:excisionase family DNA binding protein
VTHPLPALVDFVVDPSRVAELAPDEARALLGQLAVLQAPLLAKALATPAAAAKDRTDTLLLVPEAATRLGIEASYLYELIRQGRVPAVRLGPKYVRLHPTVVAEIQAKGLDPALSQQYSRARERRRARGAAEANAADASGLRRTAGRAREHSGALRARGVGDPGAGRPAREDSSG